LWSCTYYLVFFLQLLPLPSIMWLYRVISFYDCFLHILLCNFLISDRCVQSRPFQFSYLLWWDQEIAISEQQGHCTNTDPTAFSLSCGQFVLFFCVHWARRQQ
jgi:hypothetical protein